MSIATGSRHPALDVAGISDYSWIFGQSVDRLVTVEMRPTGLPYGKIDRLLDAALAESGYKSQTLIAAQALRPAARAGEAAVSPTGAAATARTVLEGLGAVPVSLCEQHHLDPILASSEAAGVPVRPADVDLRSAR